MESIRYRVFTFDRCYSLVREYLFVIGAMVLVIIRLIPQGGFLKIVLPKLLVFDVVVISNWVVLESLSCSFLDYVIIFVHLLFFMR